MKLLVVYDGTDCSDIAIDDLSRAGLPHEGQAMVACIKHADTHAPVHRLQALLPHWKVETDGCHGGARQSLIEKTRAWQPDLILVGEGEKLAFSRLFGVPICKYLLHHAHTSVRVGRRSANPADQPPRLLVAIGGAEPSQAAVRLIAARHWPAGTQARIVSAIDAMLYQAGGSGTIVYDHMREHHTAALHHAADHLRNAGLHVTAELHDAVPVELILRQAEEFHADCIFLGTKDTGFIERTLIGSISSTVFAAANCSVEVARDKT
jgi:nucleotide-binding universal stress UspA family protein